jgi:LysM repeat protein
MKVALPILLMGFCVLVSGCGVDDSEYQKAISERIAFEEKLTKAKEENASLKEEIVSLQFEKESLSRDIEKLKFELSRCDNKTGTGSSARKPDSSSGDRFYVVQQGDTLWSISRRTGVSLNTLRKLNNIQGSTLSIGQKLRLTP